MECLCIGNSDPSGLKARKSKGFLIEGAISKGVKDHCSIVIANKAMSRGQVCNNQPATNGESLLGNSPTKHVDLGEDI
ncbi:hypothetical protein V6N13_133330 [Hibiscus sabdariffa]|uniref:Uncharacterized protein n=1 Tax=Hibiscus sabdariffa TaxID=183260 RepID=A0ABR2CIH8_9ROSI